MSFIARPLQTCDHSHALTVFSLGLARYSVRLVDTREATTSSVKHDLPAPKVVDLQFSPKGSYLSTWERPYKLEDGSNARNLKIWDTEKGVEVASFERKAQEGW